jgi:hypothetical protein
MKNEKQPSTARERRETVVEILAQAVLDLVLEGEAGGPGGACGPGVDVDEDRHALATHRGPGGAG